MIKIIPIQHSGSGALVDINKVVVNGKQQLFVMFQKQKYIYNDSTRLFEKLTFPNKMGFSVADFKSAQGLTNQQVDEALEKYGPNMFLFLI